MILLTIVRFKQSPLQNNANKKRKMAIIYSYPTLTPQLGDKVLGSNIYDAQGMPVQGNPTVQYTFTAVKELVDQQYIEKLSSSNTNVITPGNNNTGSPIIFGAAQGSSSDEVMIAADGKVTFNRPGSYIIDQIYYAQATSGNNIILNFKTVQDGATQVGPTTTVKFLSNSSTARQRVDIKSYVNIVSSNYYYFWIQNPTSGATASLQPESVAAAWGTDVPSAQIIITKLQ